MKKGSLTAILMFTVILTTIDAPAQSDTAHHLYLEAKKQSFNQKWDVAAKLFKRVVRDFPESRYQEESQFWVGYCLEKDGDAKNAYVAFTQLQDKFPQSLWLDDALQHKIILAEKLASRRGDQYYSFLRRQLQHMDNDIQYQAAMALGRLGDKKALATLKSLRGKVSFDAETEEMIAALEKTKEIADEAVYADGVVGAFNDDDARKPVFRINPRDDKINYFPERRFEQYRSMARKDDNWSQEEVLRFALWHIMPTEAFDEYLALDSEAKKEWLYIFWKKNDPTPTTEENEGKQEFLRRVTFVRNTFNYFDNLNSFYYAPWDARGEIYIKFGEPEKRIINSDGELWNYPRYENVTFFIRPNVTNVFGRAIFISSLNNQSLRANSRMGDVARWRRMHNELIFQPGFYFSPQTDYTPIRNFKLLTSRKKGPGFEFRYKMPTSEFTPLKYEDGYQLSYLETYVVFDEKMKKIVRQQITRNITVPDLLALKKQRNIEQDVAVDLQPGSYTLGLRIEDPASGKIAIRKVDVHVGR